MDILILIVTSRFVISDIFQNNRSMYPYQIKSLEEYQQAYRESIDNPEKFWASVAAHFDWMKMPEKILEWNFKEPSVKWFSDGELNITVNCLDRHLETNGNDVALIWEPNDPNDSGLKLSYNDLHQRVSIFANVLKNNGAKKGDRICIYMPMVPQLAIAVLACARIGAIHTVVFAGFSASSLSDRINDCGCSLVITADAVLRGEKVLLLKPIIDEALLKALTVKKVIVHKRIMKEIEMQTGRDVWWMDEYEKVVNSGNTVCEPERMNAEDPLFILYTSGSTGKPKGVVHSCGGYMVYTTYTFVNIFQYKKGQVHFCTADVGWITGHSYTIYAPFCAGATSLMFEGIPTFPDAGRFWDIVQKHQVNILYTAPTAIRSLMGYGTGFFEGKDLSSLKVLGTVGEPINVEAWHWYDDHVGNNKCPIVDTWWQTETGGCMISNIAGVTPSRPGWASLPMPGILPIVVDEKGMEVLEKDEHGFFAGTLCMQKPWPSVLRTTYGDHERCRNNYFVTYPGLYFTGDGVLKDDEGNYRITGRVDDVLNISGHRIGTAEVENAINEDIYVIESAVVAFPHDIKGQGIYAFVILEGEYAGIPDDTVRNSVLQTVTKEIGAIAKPDKIQVVKGLPKTRSGKIMRRILRKIAEGDTENLGDISTLMDPTVVPEIQKGKID
jgi:acetyl-CoA synthetase